MLTVLVLTVLVLTVLVKVLSLTKASEQTSAPELLAMVVSFPVTLAAQLPELRPVPQQEQQPVVDQEPEAQPVVADRDLDLMSAEHLDKVILARAE